MFTTTLVNELVFFPTWLCIWKGGPSVHEKWKREKETLEGICWSDSEPMWHKSPQRRLGGGTRV